MLNQLGTDVTILIRHDKLLRNFDFLLSDTLMQIMATQGIKILQHHHPSEIIRANNGQFIIHCDGEKTVSDIDSLLFAIGRSPRTSQLNLEAVNVKTDEKNFILTDKWEATNVSHIYAIGDVTGKRLLTPVAVAAGRRLAERIFWRKNRCSLRLRKYSQRHFQPSTYRIGRHI